MYQSYRAVRMPRRGEHRSRPPYTDGDREPWTVPWRGACRGWTAA